MPCDVLVVGAGPAGALAAAILARHHVRVTLIDRARFPRPKLCGDTLNPGAIAVLSRYTAVDEIRQNALPLDGMLLTGPGVSVRGSYGDGVHGYSIERRTLDSFLVRAAVAAGAQFEEGTMVSEPIVRDGRVAGAVVKASDGRRLEYRASLVIAADGRESRLARAVALTRHASRPRRWAIGAYFGHADLDPRYGEMHVRRGRYLGVAPVPGGLANVCLVLPHSRGDGGWRDPLALLHDAINRDVTLAERFEKAELIARPQVLGPMAIDARSAGVPGMLLAGDAAGFIDPITGDGLRFALEGGAMAADVALEVLEGTSAAADAPRILRERRHLAFAGKWRFNRGIRQLVAVPAAVTAAAAAARLAPAAFRAAIRYAGDC